MDQSKLESGIESTANISSGFIISMFVWMLIVSPLIKMDVLTIDSYLVITSIFTISSWLRSYFWRRFFANGLHQVVHTFIKERYT